MSTPPPTYLDKLVGARLREERYAICGVLGGGSQGATLDAVDRAAGRPVAIKRFEVAGARSWKDVELAEREARVLSELSHDLLPSALDHFEEDGALFLVMEKIEGHNLAELGALPPAEVFHFLEDSSEILAYLHGRVAPVIHRDIKPGNVIRRPARDGQDESRARYVFVDFGSVRNSLKPAGGSTVVGTFGFMAPEQFQGRAMPQSDVYGVGATAISMLTGKMPEDLPHRGLAIDVAAACREANVDDPRWHHLLERLLDPNPDTRATAIGPLLATAGPSTDDGPPSSDRRRQDPPQRRGRRAKRKVRAHANRLPWFLALFATMGLLIARIGILLTLRVAVPVVLTLLSIAFGRSWQRAARRVGQAGQRASDTLKRAQRGVSGRPTNTGEEAERAGADERAGRRKRARPTKRRRRREKEQHDRTRGVRVHEEKRDANLRIDESDEDESLVEQLDEAVEEAVEAVDEIFGGKRRG